MAEFFDAFYMATEPEERAAMVADEPAMPFLHGTQQPDQAGHVYLAGIVEWLCARANIEAPTWIFNPDRYSTEGIYSKYDKTEEQRELRKSWTLPELVKRGFYINDRLHERSFRWITGFDPEHTEMRREAKRRAALVDSRIYRILQLLVPEDGSPVPPEKTAQLRTILKAMKNAPYPRLEEALAIHEFDAAKLGVDLSPLRPAARKTPDQFKIA